MRKMNKEIYEEYKRKRQELRAMERITAQRCAELRSLAQTFGGYAGDIVKLYVFDEKDWNTIKKLAGDVCVKAFKLRLKATKLENQLDLLRYSLRLDTHYKIMDAKWKTCKIDDAKWGK